ncbi:MAG: site-specific integrase, partial [Candidatus Paceibacterota bacterium]
SEVLSHILGRRINVHIFKNSCITMLLERGVDINLVSKFVAHHEDVSTTQIYDLRDFEEEKGRIFNK